MSGHCLGPVRAEREQGRSSRRRGKGKERDEVACERLQSPTESLGIISEKSCARAQASKQAKPMALDFDSLVFCRSRRLFQPCFFSALGNPAAAIAPLQLEIFSRDD